MFQIDNEKFGQFLCTLRKEKNWTQKELADRLFVSDKTISKWERGASIPNVSLLIPIAETLDVTVTELLKGERLPQRQPLSADDADALVTGALDMSLREQLRTRRKSWLVAFVAGSVVTALECFFLVTNQDRYATVWQDASWMAALFLLMAAWFFLFAKETLPAYYDDNRISFVQQGIFRINMIGIAFNNSNWPSVCTCCRVLTLAPAVLYPALCLILAPLVPADTWADLQTALLVLYLLALFGSIAIVAKKYE